MDQKGTKSVTIKITGNEKLRASVMLAVLADGRIFHSEIRYISVYIVCLLYTSPSSATNWAFFVAHCYAVFLKPPNRKPDLQSDLVGRIQNALPLSHKKKQMSIVLMFDFT